MVDIRQSKNYASYLSTQGWTVERKNSTNYFIKKIPIVGSVLKVQRPKIVDFEKIKTLQKKYRVFQTIIEPDLGTNNTFTTKQHKSFVSQGYKLSKSPYLPSKTLHIGLTQPVKQIVSGFKKDTRRAVKVGRRTIIKGYSTPKQLGKFHKTWKKSVNFGRFVPSLQSLINLRKSFPNTYSFFLASHNVDKEIIGGSVFLRSGKDILYYWYGFTNSEGRSSLSQYSLLYSGLLWGKKQGCRIFDFEGIYDERFPNKSWLGFSHFKKGFGGKEILYPGCYTKISFPRLFL